MKETPSQRSIHMIVDLLIALAVTLLVGIAVNVIAEYTTK